MFWKKRPKKDKLPFTLEYELDRRRYFRVKPDPAEPVFLEVKGRRLEVIDLSAGGVAFRARGLKMGQRFPGLIILPRGEPPVPLVLRVVKVVPGKMIAGDIERIKEEDRERLHLYVLRRQKEELERRRLERLTETEEGKPPVKH